MKKIFDWMREQISKLHKKNPYESYWERERYLATEATNYERDETIRQVYKLINEAEAKWKAECCEWKRGCEHKDILFSPHEQVSAMFESCLPKYPYCSVCGKLIKISEVE